MKQALTFTFACLVTSILILSCAIGGCSAPDDFGRGYCDPNAFLPDSWCRKIDASTDAESDAGTDAESDADTDGPSATDEPGFESSVFPTCKTECLPEASGPTALDWPNEPFIVWFGPSSELEENKCPPGTPYEKSLVYDKLVAPPAKCDACACLANGSCTGLPENIEIRSGTCNTSNVETTPFDGPPNWDGSCTSVNAMTAGQLCNGVPCAQSLSASTLPGPTNESCVTTVEKPHATLDKHEWLEGARACRAQDLEGTCAIAPEHCVDKLPDGWLRCIVRTGKHEICPGNYNDYEPRWYYDDNPIDDRGCSDCACGTPKDSVCVGSLRLYSDSSCATEINRYQMASTGPLCADLQPPGLALGSKTIGNLSFFPGTCSVTGGEPIGTVIPNDDENSVTTICCRSSELPPLPPIR